MRWTIQSIQEPVFELFEAAIFAGMPDADRMPQDTIKNWTARGYLKPVMGKRGKKNLRLYSTGDLLRIFVVSSLVWQHTSIEASFIAAERLIERLKDCMKLGSFVIDPNKEFWLIFQDHGSRTEEFTLNERTNFELAVAYVTERGAFPPLCEAPEFNVPFEVKQETFNADRLIRKFIQTFYKYNGEGIFAEKAPSSYYLSPPSGFQVEIEAFISPPADEVQP